MKPALAIFLRKTPFLRFIIPLIAGIILQWYFQLPLGFGIIVFTTAFVPLLLFFQLNYYRKFRYRWVQGVLMHLVITALGMVLIFVNDIRNNKNWFAKQYRPADKLIVTLNEQPVSKKNSYKAEAAVTSIIRNDTFFKTNGNIIIYFKKDSIINQYRPGMQLIFRRVLQEIKNNGNPAAFDYREYALFKGTTHQVYLTSKDYEVLAGKNISGLKNFLYQTRAYVLQTLQSYIKGPKEQGLAEALLIGYKDDLDKRLLQSYTNTGVVHIIAVSGMHIALLYWLLNLIFQPFLRKKNIRWLHPFLVITSLWLFSLITGGAASIIRAAVMFTFVKLGKSINRNASIYNILLSSAFCLLCYNPFWLWDVGFQLSYAAVLSIVIFYKPIYSLLFLKNKLLNLSWQLVAVSISAQILTTPLSIYYFHQFPIYFLITNLVAVPLSSIILIGEFILILISPVSSIARVGGAVLEKLIWWLNSFIERIENFPFALWSGLQISVFQVILLFSFITFISLWLFEKLRIGLWLSLLSLLLILFLRVHSFSLAEKQAKIIVYNVPKNSAVDFIEGRRFRFYADSAVLNDNSMKSFYINPSRLMNRLYAAGPLQDFYQNGDALYFKNKRILWLHSSLAWPVDSSKINTDLVLLSGNPRLYITELQKRVLTKQIVIDGSVPSWKARFWQHDCDSLGIPCHDVSREGAFVMNLR